jgi:hypothetical protein
LQIPFQLVQRDHLAQVVQIAPSIQELPTVVDVVVPLVIVELLVVLAAALVVVQRLVELDLRVVMAAVPLTLNQLDGLLVAAVVQEVIPVIPPVALELLFLSQDLLKMFVVAEQAALAHLDPLIAQVTRDLMDIVMDPLFLVLRHLLVLLTPLVVEAEHPQTQPDSVLAVVVIRNLRLLQLMVVMALLISEFPKTS